MIRMPHELRRRQLLRHPARQPFGKLEGMSTDLTREARMNLEELKAQVESYRNRPTQNDPAQLALIDSIVDVLEDLSHQIDALETKVRNELRNR